MLPESALHYQSIAFTRGGAPATAPLSSSTLGDTWPPRLLEPEREHREGHERIKRQYNRLHQLQAPSEIKNIKKEKEGHVFPKGLLRALVHYING